MISAKIILDSVNRKTRIVTWELTYPRFIHSEFMTHRVFSRNAASSRAIPIRVSVNNVRDNPASFAQWGANKPGMQAGANLDLLEENRAKHTWNRAAHSACEYAESLADTGVHKQVANRVLEPFSHITTLATATELANFFKLRAHPDAQPEFQVLAYTMLKAMLESRPRELRPGQWHAPLLSASELDMINGDDLLASSGNPLLAQAAARCARVSFNNHGKDAGEDSDRQLVERLTSGGHWSPFEHIARAEGASNEFHGGNFRGFKQLRKFYANETITEINYSDLYETRPEWVSKIIDTPYALS